MKKLVIILLCTCCMLKLSAQISYKADPKRDQFVRQLLKKMTLDEKIGQMHQLPGKSSITGPSNPKSKAGQELRSGQVGSFLNLLGVKEQIKLQKIAVDSTRLGIPLIFAYDIIHGMRTIFPIPLAESCCWDLNLIEQSARIAAIEGTASGISWTFAPMVDIARDARWGRIAEGAGEDPYWGCLVAKARVRGFQGDHLSDKTTMAACAKHFAAYGASESGIDYHRVELSDRTLRSVYLPPFKAAVDAGVMTFMNAFHQLNGIPCTGNQYLVDQILKKEWKFPGVVVSDYNSVGEQMDHFYATDTLDAAKKAALARCDIDMCSYTYKTHLKEAVQKGLVPMANIDDAVYRILSLKYQLGLFDDAYRYLDTIREKTDILTPAHRTMAREVAKRSIVLLKNESKTLPLNRNIASIALIGEMAKDAKENMLGSWAAQGKAKDVRSIYDGLVAKGFQTILYHKGVSCTNEDTTGIGAALQIAGKAEHILLCIGENRRMSGEAQSRIGIEISENQMQLARAILALNKPTTILLCNGRPLAIPELAQKAPAILEIWQLGTEAGDAVADVLTGDYNPSGKLTTSFPYHVGQMPLYYGRHSSGRPLTEANPKDRYKTGYRDAPMAPLYPFGFGLSYTQFDYSNIKSNRTTLLQNGKIDISVRLKNTGDIAGEEVVQLYIQNLSGRVAFPTRELKAYKKVMLAAGESQEIIFSMDARDFANYDQVMHWTVMPGKYRVYVGGNSIKTQMIEISIK